ncbi:MAG TPA: site-2 protease family protein [Terriglobales bacterium]|nr:site-2 protease family protein [Terriglobales bacterium]
MNELRSYELPQAVRPPRPWVPEPEPAPAKPKLAVHILLFLATFATTTIAGAGPDVFSDWRHLVAGLPFSVTLLGILFVHEMGHYTVARLHGVDASLPYFIPAPPLLGIGTFGAFIRMSSPTPNRRALFDVGAAGPWAGLIAAIPALLIGLSWSEVRPTGLIEGGLNLGEPLLFTFLSDIVLGDVSDEMTVVLHPVALAGWFGLLVTFFNLLPIGQLDGGHVVYSLLGRWHRWVARGFLALIIIMGFQGWPGWFVWVGLLAIIGLDHPPTLDPWIGLDRGRKLAVFATAIMFVLTFMPEPFSQVEPPPAFEGTRTPVAWRAGEPPLPAPGPRFVFAW